MKVVLSFVLLLAPFSLSAATLTEKDCEFLGMTGASAMSNKTKGVSKEELKATLPPLESVSDDARTKKDLLVIEMHKTLDQVFDQESINPTAYMVYRSESCFQKVNGRDEVPYEKTHQKLVACSIESNTEKIINCSMKASGASE